MADSELNVVIKLDDQLSAGMGNAQKQVQSFGQGLEDAGHSVKMIGREIDILGKEMTFFGAGISAPFIIALKDMGKNSFEANQIFNDLAVTTKNFGDELATAVLPLFRESVNRIIALKEAFDKLPGPLKETILQGAYLTGQFLVVAGLMAVIIGTGTKLIGMIMLLTGQMITWAAANMTAIVTFGAVGAALAGLVYLMFQFKGVADTVMSTFEVLFRFLQNGFMAVEAILAKFVEGTINGLKLITDALSKIPGPTQEAFKAMSENLAKASVAAHDFANDKLQGIITNTQKITQVIQTGQGDWFKAFDSFKNGAISAIEFIKNFGKTTHDVVQTAKTDMTQLFDLIRNLSNQGLMESQRRVAEQVSLLKFYQKEWNTAHAGMAAFTQTVAQSIQTNMSSALTGIITGTETAKQAFQALGQAMIQTIVDFMAQKLVAWALEKTILAGTVATSILAASAIADAWAPAAAMVSLATFGANGAPASAAIAGTSALASGLAKVAGAMQKFHSGGVVGTGLGSDEVPAILQTGEGVLSRQGMANLGGPTVLNAINSGAKVQGKTQEGNIIINITVSGNIGSQDDIRRLTQEMGYEVKRAKSYPRGSL